MEMIDTLPNDWETHLEELLIEKEEEKQQELLHLHDTLTRIANTNALLMDFLQDIGKWNEALAFVRSQKSEAGIIGGLNE